MFCFELKSRNCILVAPCCLGICTINGANANYPDVILLMLTANRAANKSASCQDQNDVNLTNYDSSEVIVIVLSLLLTATFIAFIISVGCLITRHKRQLAAIGYDAAYLIDFVYRLRQL